MSSCLDILIALHYWTRPGDYAGFGLVQESDAHKNSPAVKESIKHLVDRGLLRERTENDPPFDTQPANYIGTDALRVYVLGLCNVPLPVQVWVIPKDDPHA